MNEENDNNYIKLYEKKFWISEYYEYYENFLKYIGYKKQQFKITNSDVNMIKQLNRVDDNNTFGLILDISLWEDERFITWHNDECLKEIIINSVKMKMCDDENKEIDDNTRLRFEKGIPSEDWSTIATFHYRDVRTIDGYKMKKVSTINRNKSLLIWTSVYKDNSIPDIIQSVLEKPKIDLCINPEYTKFEILFDSWTIDRNIFDHKKAMEYLNKEELKDVKEKIVSAYIKRSNKETPILSAYKIDWKTKEVTKEN